MLGYDSNSHVYHVFKKDSDCVEPTCDTMFDETNDSQVEKYDLDDVDHEEASCTMAIGHVRLQDVNEDQPSSNKAAPTTQANDQDQEDEQNEDDGQDQDMGNDHGGVEQDEDEDE
jgi:hypothetical protein